MAKRKGKENSLLIEMDAVEWKNAITAISSVVDEANFNITPDGVSVLEMDPSHVAMVDFSWPKHAFSEFVCKKKTKICLNVAEMLKLLKRVSADETLEIRLIENSLTMRLSNGYTRNFSVHALDPISEEVPSVKNFKFNAKAKVATSFLKDAVEDTSLVHDSVKLEMTKDKLTFMSEGSSGSVSIELDEQDEDAIKFEAKETARAIFSLEYLKDVIKSVSSSASSMATLEFSSKMPMRLNFEIGKGKLKFYLAPRIED